MMTEGGVEVQLERERHGRERKKDLLGPLSAQRGGGHPKVGDVTRIGRSDWPRPPARPCRDGRKLQHSISGKMTLHRKNILL